jgi:hypothetical protein
MAEYRERAEYRLYVETDRHFADFELICAYEAKAERPAGRADVEDERPRVWYLRILALFGHERGVAPSRLTPAWMSD